MSDNLVWSSGTIESAFGQKGIWHERDIVSPVCIHGHNKLIADIAITGRQNEGQLWTKRCGYKDSSVGKENHW